MPIRQEESGCRSAERVLCDMGLIVNAVGEVAATASFCGTTSFGGASPLVSAIVCPNNDTFAARFGSDGSHLNSVRGGGTTGSEKATPSFRRLTVASS